MSQEERKTYFADVIVPVPVPGTFTYRVPRVLEGQVMAGQRVIVQFGKKKYMQALFSVFIIRYLRTTTPNTCWAY